MSEQPEPNPGLQATRLLCINCYVEKHAGQRETVNPAALIVAGNSSCTEHIVIQQAPMLPDRTPGGIILGG